ncbi:MAG: hypothetical protein AB7L09_17555 [Nitrospira sp.]
MKRFALFLAIGLAGIALSVVEPVHAVTMAQLELTGGAVNYDGKHSQMMDRLLGQEGTLKLGQFQAIGELLPSIDKACETYSLFTSGFSGAAAPSATISGSSISVDLSSLFFGASRGDFHKTWNIGELATGQYDPGTREFTVSWDHMFQGGTHAGLATFFLKGVADMETHPVAIPASLVLYATGLFGLGSWTWWQRRPSLSAAA